ncbi:hypothetical protein FGADI_2071 [Fusarium gaditjirri]|uniref:HNH nuclease domain-containing protein n=1 Tax=Fusarium gaditjirri TaxID=282569 RepID=A0A8H4TJH0_9HYPO|nr:hypothetical protein FGADI_2071 [Fusarium gaditjirri]
MAKFTQSNGLVIQYNENFIEPDPLLSLFESSKRLEYAKQLEASIQTNHADMLPDFRLDIYHIATILTLHPRNFTPGLRFSMETRLINGRPYRANHHLKIVENLEEIPPFCRHYMMNLGAADIAPELQAYVLMDDEPQPTYSDVDSDDMDVDLKRLWRKHTRTIPSLKDHVRDEAEAARCRVRDGNICIVTGKPNPKTYHIIPFTCNDTVKHNNKTEDVREGAERLVLNSFGMEAGFVVNPRTLGGSDKEWNQICLDPELYSWWAKGYCAFKFMGSQNVGEGKEMATLQFRWMPLIRKRPYTMMNIHGTGPENDWLNLMDELDTFHAQHQPPPTIGDRTLRATTKTGALLRSGYLINICLPKDDVKRFEVAVDLQWYSIIFMAFISAAGNPEMPPRDSLQEKVVTWLEDKPNVGEQEGMKTD